MITNLSFTDPQGQAYTGAVVSVLSARFSKYWNGSSEETITLNTADVTAELVPTVNEQDYDSEEVAVTFAYWPTQAAFEDGRPFYTLSNFASRDSNTFVISKEELADPKFADSSLVEKCETYFLETILPNLG